MTYVDTSAFIAFADASDSYHTLVRKLFSAPPPGMFTTSLVVSEGHAWFLRRFDQSRALGFLGMIEDMSFLDIVTTGKPELVGGVKTLRRFADQDLTLVDAIGVFLMELHKAATCWSTDRHLGLTGVTLVIHT